MMAKLKTSSADMVAAARARIAEIDSADAIALHGRDDVIFVDLRDVRERQRTGFIPGSFHCPRGMLEFWVDPESPYHRDVFAQTGKTYIFFCAAAWRSALATRDLQDMGFGPVAQIEGGFKKWREDGFPVDEPEPKPALKPEVKG